MDPIVKKTYKPTLEYMAWQRLARAMIDKNVDHAYNAVVALKDLQDDK